MDLYASLMGITSVGSVQDRKGPPDAPALAREAFQARLSAPSVHRASLCHELVSTTRGGMAHPDEARHRFVLTRVQEVRSDEPH